MSEVKVAKPVEVVLPFVRYTPEQILTHKKQRDGRRKAIRSQNAESKLMR